MRVELQEFVPDVADELVVHWTWEPSDAIVVSLLVAIEQPDAAEVFATLEDGDVGEAFGLHRFGRHQATGSGSNNQDGVAGLKHAVQPETWLRMRVPRGDMVQVQIRQTVLDQLSSYGNMRAMADSWRDQGAGCVIRGGAEVRPMMLHLLLGSRDHHVRSGRKRAGEL